MSRKCNLFVERLDTRTLLAAVSWDGGGDGASWHDPANWSNNLIPTANDDVTINIAGTPTIMIDNVAEAKSLVTNEAMSMTWQLTVANACTFNSTVFINGLELKATTITFNDDVTFAVGTINANTTLASGQELTLIWSDIAKTFAGAFTNNGTVNHTEGHLALSNSVFNNAGVLNITSLGWIEGAGTINNTGTISRSGSGATPLSNDVSIVNNSVLNVTEGTLQGYAGGVTNITGNGTLNISPNATLAINSFRQNTVNIQGELKLTYWNEDHLVTSTVNTLNLTGDGVLDLSFSALVVNYTGSSVLNSINTKVLSGYNNGAWNGVGIHSSAITSNSGLWIGFGEASQVVGANGGTWAGVNVDSTAVLLRTVRGGDANLSRNVDFSDLLVLAQNYGSNGKAFTQGNFNYSANGSVDFNDLLILAQNYGQSALFPNRPAAHFSARTIRDAVLN